MVNNVRERQRQRQSDWQSESDLNSIRNFCDDWKKSCYCVPRVFSKLKFENWVALGGGRRSRPLESVLKSLRIFFSVLEINCFKFPPTASYQADFLVFSAQYIYWIKGGNRSARKILRKMHETGGKFIFCSGWAEGGFYQSPSFLRRSNEKIHRFSNTIGITFFTTISCQEIMISF